MKTAEQIAKDAKSSEEVPEGYSLLELHLWLCIKQLLTMFYNGQLTKEQAAKKKQLAIKVYEDMSMMFEFEKNNYQSCIKNINKTESLRIQLRKVLNSNEENTFEKATTILLELVRLYSGEEFEWRLD